MGFSTKETENTYAALGHITYKKMYYNKSWILDFILYVYQNNLMSGGEKNNKNALLSQVTSIILATFRCLLFCFFFYRKNRDILLYLNVIKPPILQNVHSNVHNRHTTFLLEIRTAPILTKKSYTYYYVPVLYYWKLYL